jgi:hypothetical protein
VSIDKRHIGETAALRLRGQTARRTLLFARTAAADRQAAAAA